MTEIILQPVCSKTIPDYQTSVVLNETVELLLELNQVPQIPHISKRLNKKRKKNPLSKSEGSYQKKTKLNDKEANQDDDIDMDINDRDIESLSFSTKKSKKKYCYNIWYDTLNKVKQYIDENNKRPSYADKDIKIKLLGSWLGTQNRNYKIKKRIMKDEEIYCKYTQFMNDYEKYFLNNNLKSNNLKNNNKYLYNIWYNNLNKVKDYINKKKTTESNKDKEIQKLRKWISTQTKNYKKKEKLMRNEDIYSEWTQFINEYQEYFLSNEEIWYNNLNKVKDYINKNKKKPYESDKNKEIKQLGCWLNNQQKKYKKKENIYSEWTNFMNDYKEYLSSNEEIWYNNLIKVKEYIDKNKKRPSNSDKDIEIKSLSSWICNQQNKYNNKKHIMKNEDIYSEWTNFMNEYQEYLKSLKSNEEIWYDTLNKVKEYIDENSKRPSNSDKDIEIKSLSSWIDNQQNKYNNKKHIMKNEDIYSEWTNFMNKYQEYLKSYQEYLKSYQEYLLSNEEIWYNNLIKVKEYIVKNKKRPSKSDKDIEIKQLSRWINTQNNNYKTIKHTMKNEDIYSEWTNFMNDYKEYIKSYQEYLLSNEEIWYNNLIKVKEYIVKNKKRPNSTDKDIEIKQLGRWINTQNKNYKTKKHTMKNENIYSEWTNFMNDYKEYIKNYQEYLLSNEEIWYNNLIKVKEYIDNNNKKPHSTDKDIEIKQLASWIYIQQNKYNYKKHIMKNEDIYCEWTNFMNDYKEYFLSNEEIWYNNLNKVKEYIVNNKKRLSTIDKNKEIKQLASWIGTQHQNYKKKEHNMKNEEIYCEWTQFLEQYQEYFN
jgi:hypothetical protein